MDTTEKIKPALTPQEWASFAERAELTREQLGWACEEVSSSIDNVNRHGLAALALYGRPFGFTRTDVRALRAAVESRLSLGTEDGNRIGAFYLAGLADRIEALLPPPPNIVIENCEVIYSKGVGFQVE